jgi:hypothetical protein
MSIPTPSRYSGYYWYRLTVPIPGYIATDYITPTGSSPSYATYDRQAAASYALQYSSNTSGTASYNSAYTVFPSDCANFVSQCLYAGGMYKTTGDAGWHPNTYPWKGTISLKNFLEGRGWGSVVPAAQVQQGDICYTYDPSMSPGDEYTHVVFVNNVSGGNVYTCGHTANKNNAIRVTPSGCQSVYVHINNQLPLIASDYR